VKGKGTFKWKATGALYDGDWKEDMRNGFGTYSIPTEDGGYTKQYSGGWKDNKKHVCIATLSVYVYSSALSQCQFHSLFIIIRQHR